MGYGARQDRVGIFIPSSVLKKMSFLTSVRRVVRALGPGGGGRVVQRN